ncbi:TRAP transporter substrate-binding protein [Clostridium sp. AN503]|uniref:TRAP transporter substrate-binding protein n=1 Tax=Clostridium sp. AN503 TaxID=3160598 RepID=UPI00345B2EA2
MKKRIGLLFLCTAALTSLTLLTSCGGRREAAEDTGTPEYVLTYAENQAEDYPTTKGAYRFAELVKERTEGKIIVQVNAGAVLGDEQSVVEQMQFGGIDFTRASISSMGEFLPKINVLQMPYLYTGPEHMWKVLDGEIGNEFLESFEEIGLIGLSWYDAGARNFYNSVRPIQKLEDLKGMKIRVQESKMMGRMVELLGASSVPMTYADVYSALQTGQIDGAENNWPSYESEHHYEVARYMTVDEHTRVPEVQIIAKATWEKLTPEYQTIIRECARESAEYERMLWNQRSEASRKKVLEAGCEVVELSPEEKLRFQEAVTPIYNEFCGDYVDLIDQIVAAGR